MPPAPFVLVPGAGGDGRYWDRVLPLLPAAVALDLPPDAEGFDDYVDAVAAVLPDEPAVLVGQSMGAFTVALVAERFPTRAVVLLAPMVPAPGDTAGSWWERTGHAAAVADAATAQGLDPAAILPGPGFDPHVAFFHDLPPDVLAELLAGEEPGQSAAVFDAEFPLRAWPDVPTRVLAGRDDRFFPLPFVQRLARERLGVEAEVVPGGHLAALSHPGEVARALLA